ncbi:ABC transporter ATP-binding protein [Tumidithrix elongata RA019]|uniref:ABC transporter ATP-binding protein n=1 Tax=Tumidithrix elongata BACA0141 TaxID=2716417 RepID=A0AAW9PVN3_9CYAN|nr:ABC transporter ATP-binding protein [Tumidithrix elongata RA019]
MNDRPILSVNQLQVDFKSDQGIVPAVRNVSFELMQGQTLGIVGESGSGKSVTALAIMGLLAQTGKITQGEILFDTGTEQVNLANMPSERMRQYRGDRISMIFQEPMTSLNPLFTCGYQIIEVLQLHQHLSKQAATARAIQLFTEVKLPNPEQIIKRYPHELSGGQLQRVMIAIAICCNPMILIADEPTTALDVTVQATILDLLRQLQQERQMSIVFISHDLGVIAQIADRVAVMYKGQVVEFGQTQAIFREPQHSYTKGLVACRPQPALQLKYLPTVSDYMEEVNGEIIALEPNSPRLKEVVTLADSENRLKTLEAQPALLKVRDLRVDFPIRGVWGETRRYFVAVNNISFDVYPGETLGLVGESGCGKTTTGRAILRLIKPTGGDVWFEGKNVTTMGAEELQRLRCEMQIVFQDPYGSLNPRMSVGDAIAEPLEIHAHQEQFKNFQSALNRKNRVAYLLERVGLDRSAMRRYPHEFSGGQRQRICIARALALNPKLIIADESVSALDVSVQAQVLNLLKELQAEFGLTYIFISHDLSVVKFMSDRIVVMNKGKIEEMGAADAIYNYPQQPYTQTLIDAIPTLDLATTE